MFNTWGYLFCTAGFFIPVVCAVIVVVRALSWFVSMVLTIKVALWILHMCPGDFVFSS